jgi:hypothetical protein
MLNRSLCRATERELLAEEYRRTAVNHRLRWFGIFLGAPLSCTQAAPPPGTWATPSATPSAAAPEPPHPPCPRPRPGPLPPRAPAAIDVAMFVLALVQYFSRRASPPRPQPIDYPAGADTGARPLPVGAGGSSPGGGWSQSMGRSPIPITWWLDTSKLKIEDIVLSLAFDGLGGACGCSSARRRRRPRAVPPARRCKETAAAPRWHPGSRAPAHAPVPAPAPQPRCRAAPPRSPCTSYSPPCPPRCSPSLVRRPAAARPCGPAARQPAGSTTHAGAPARPPRPPALHPAPTRCPAPPSPAGVSLFQLFRVVLLWSAIHLRQAILIHSAIMADSALAQGVREHVRGLVANARTAVGFAQVGGWGGGWRPGGVAAPPLGGPGAPWRPGLTAAPRPVPRRRRRRCSSRACSRGSRRPSRRAPCSCSHSCSRAAWAAAAGAAAARAPG